MWYHGRTIDQKWICLVWTYKYFKYFLSKNLLQVTQLPSDTFAFDVFGEFIFAFALFLNVFSGVRII